MQKILDFLRGGNEAPESTPGMAQQILSARFQPTLEDTTNAAIHSAFTRRYADPQTFADARLKRAMEQLAAVAELEQLPIKAKLAQAQLEKAKRDPLAEKMALMRYQYTDPAILSGKMAVAQAGGMMQPMAAWDPRTNRPVYAPKGSLAGGDLLPPPPPGNTYGPGGHLTRKLTATEQKEIFETEDLLNSAQGAITALTKAQEIMNPQGATQPYSGWLAEERAAASRIPVIGDIVADKERGAATTEYRTLVMDQALNNLKAIFGGMPTEGERQVLLQMQALPNYTPQEQKRIIDNAISAAQRRLKFNQQKIHGIKAGEYGTTDQDWLTQLTEPGGAASSTIDSSLLEFMTPEERALFDGQ